LTFSGRINLRGKLLDTKVTPGVLRNVLYMTPATLSAVVGETPLVNKRVITVGASTPKLPRKSPRQLIEAYEMTEMDKKNIKLLHTLGKSRQSLLSARGNLMFSSPSYEIKVTSNDDSVEHSENFPYIGKVSDPRIDLKVEPWSTDENRDHGNTVMNIMLLAGEVGARWCQERGIPIINRISQPHPDDPDPTKYFRRIILPLMNRSRETSSEPRNYDGEDSESDKSRVERTGSSQSQANDLMASSSFGAPKMVPLDMALEYQRLLGAVTPSTTPGPHLHIGLDMFTRNTSPLRRYSDLLVHWQIEAALLEEARSGQSLVGSMREDYLPFKKDELDRFLPLLHWRENELRGHDRAAQRIWAMQLILRAWKFNEAPLPATFELWAHTFDKETVTGYLTYFGGLSATFELRSWLLEEDLRAGDVFEVELADLDIYKKSLVVKPLRRLRRTAERAI
jgi:exoribonuclease R